MLTGISTCFFCLSMYAQPLLKATIDKNKILVGEQATVTIEVSFANRHCIINSIEPSEPLQHFELIKRGNTDSAFRLNEFTGFRQQFIFTSFDSGSWVLPALNIKLQTTDTFHVFDLFTDSFPVEVSFSKQDSTGKLKDIHPIREVGIVGAAFLSSLVLPPAVIAKEAYIPGLIWYFVIAVLLFLLALSGALWFYKRRKKGAGVTLFTSAVSPYDEAITEIGKLQQHSSEPADVKFLHTRLSEVFKRYLSRKQNKNYLNKTTGDTLQGLHETNIDRELITKAAGSLRCSDAVKFARYIPSASENIHCVEDTREVISEIEKQFTKKETKD